MSDGGDCGSTHSSEDTKAKLANLGQTHPGMHVTIMGIGSGIDGRVERTLQGMCQPAWCQYVKCGDNEIKDLFKTVQKTIEGRYSKMCRKLKQQTSGVGFSDVKPTGKDTDPLNACELAAYEYLLLGERNSKAKGYTR